MDKKPDNITPSAFSHKPPEIKPKMFAYEFLDLSATIDGSPYIEGTFAPHLHMKGIRSRRKTIRVVPYANEFFELLVPNGFTLADMKQFVAENGREIYAKLQEMLDAEFSFIPPPPTYDSTVPYLGAETPIRVLPDGGDGCYIKDGAFFLPPGLYRGEIREAALRLMGELAYGVFKPKLDRYAKMMKLKYSRLLIDDGRRSFGSYNQMTGDIFLSRRLLMMSGAVIDFLIVHELAHAEEFAHSGEHDAVMERIMPDYDERDIEFHESCQRLIEQGWL